MMTRVPALTVLPAVADALHQAAPRRRPRVHHRHARHALPAQPRDRARGRGRRPRARRRAGDHRRARRHAPGRVGVRRARAPRRRRVGRPGEGSFVKASRRDLPAVVAAGRSAGTTVAATMRLAHLAGIRVFATGGIGGVHRGAETTFDVSADLDELATHPRGRRLGRRQGDPRPAPHAGGARDPRRASSSATGPTSSRRSSAAPVAWRSTTAPTRRPSSRPSSRRTWRLGGRGGILVANPVPVADALARRRSTPRASSGPSRRRSGPAWGARSSRRTCSGASSSSRAGAAWPRTSPWYATTPRSPRRWRPS